MEASVGKITETGVLARGTGLCAEAQADGVPCTTLGKDCEICEKVYARPEVEGQNLGELGRR